MDLLSRVRRTIHRHGLAAPSTRVIVALSGGPDSMALAHLLRALDRAGELRVAGVAHFNHKLRACADSDARFCEQAAFELGWPIAVGAADVGARARAEKRSIEDTAHRLRYAFFEETREKFHADVVALGHTRDDQAETFLLRLVRGAGSRGFAAMRPTRGMVIRPLIECRRAQLRAFLDELHVPFLVDPSNSDVSIPRNRVRAELLPMLESRFNPSVVDALANSAELAREEFEWLEHEAAALGERIVTRDADGWRVDADALNAAPLAAARTLMHELMTRAAGGRTISFEHVQAALDISRQPAGAVDAPSLHMDRDGRFLVLMGKPAGAAGRWAGNPANPSNLANPANLFWYPLSIPGEAHIAESRCVVSAETAESEPAGNSPTAVRVRRDRISGPLAVRSRRPGDRFRPVGLAGRKKLQDYFVDAKVPRGERDLVPIIVDGRDRIVWVAGHAVDDEFRVTDVAQGVLLLRLRRV